MTGGMVMRKVLAVVSGVVLVASTVASTVVTAGAGHSPALSSGVYRIPYIDGTSVQVNNDSHNHNTAYDMTAGRDAQLVAAASGWIRAIVDHHGNDPNPGDGLDAQDPPQPQDDSLEHACLSNDPSDTVAAGTSCSDYNNYVWIEHPNGEYTKYSHVGTGTTSALGWQVGDWIEAGEVLGLENDPGAASCGACDPDDRAFHLHWEVARPNTPGADLVWTELGGFIQNGTRVQAVVCDIPGNDLIRPGPYTANPCTNQAPTADAGGPYSVEEGSTIVLDGTGSSDPDGTPLTYAWTPDADLDDASLVQPTFTAVDDAVIVHTLTVYDQVEAASDSDTATVTVANVAPVVTAVGDAIVEGGTAVVRATFTDPGTMDTHTATIDWGDGSPIAVPTVASLNSGVPHTYGDDGTYDVTVTVTDDDGGVGVDVVQVVVANADPTLDLDVSGQVAFPGGDFFVLSAGEDLALSADGSDPGSDDLTFDWSTGASNTYFNDGIGPDPAMSPFGTYPFAASDGTAPVLATAGATSVSVSLLDDDGGSDDATADVIVTGTADATKGSGWWKHQFSGSGSPHIDPALADAYLGIVDAVSSVFSEQTSAVTADDAHTVLSPSGNDARARARSELLLAWLHFASGAVSHEASIQLGGGSGSVGFLDLLSSAEDVILDPSASKSELGDVERDLQRVRHAT